MTTTVKKGAGRPAAAERSARHAQKDTLSDAKIRAYGKTHHLNPEAIETMIEAARAVKAETVQEALAAWEDLGDGSAADEAVEAARAIVPDPAPEKPMGEKTVKELHTIAGKIGIAGHRSLKRGDLLTAILEAEQAAVTVPAAKSPGARAADAFAVAAQADLPTTPLVPIGGKSYPKAQAFAEAAKSAGWNSLVKEADPETDRIMVEVRRGETESIEIEWIAGVFQGECYYSHAGRSAVKLRNASAAKKQMAVPPAEAAATAQKVSAHKAARPRQENPAGTVSARRKALPLDLALATDAEVLSALHNRNIAWANEISGTIEDAYVSGQKPRITEGTSGRQIEFVSATGYRTVRLSSIVSVR